MRFAHTSRLTLRSSYFDFTVTNPAVFRHELQIYCLAKGAQNKIVRGAYKFDRVYGDAYDPIDLAKESDITVLLAIQFIGCCR